MQYLLKYNGYQSACCKLFENNSATSFKIAFIFVIANKYYLVFALFLLFFTFFTFASCNFGIRGRAAVRLCFKKEQYAAIETSL